MRSKNLFKNLFIFVRKENGLTQQRMAEYLGVRQGQISKIENGTVQEPSALVFLRLMKVANTNRATAKTVKEFLSKALN